MRSIEELVGGGPFPVSDGTKDDKGTLVIVGGPPECPGAVLLAATAALRAGCGRVQLVVHPAVAAAVATAMPEALVLGWDPGVQAPDDVRRRLAQASAVLLGPGLGHEPEAAVDEAASCVGDGILVLDAGALPAVARFEDRPNVLIVPNASEAARLTGGDDDAEPADLAPELADRFGRPVAVRGPTTVVADPHGGAWSLDGPACLGTPGSGDVLVGILGALLAREVPPLEAEAWAVLVHAAAGRVLERRHPLGWLAREIVDAVQDGVAQVVGG